MKTFSAKVTLMLLCFIFNAGFLCSFIIPLNHQEISAKSGDYFDQNYSSLIEAEPNKVILSFSINSKLSFRQITINNKSFSSLGTTDIYEMPFEIDVSSSSKNI